MSSSRVEAFERMVNVHQQEQNDRKSLLTWAKTEPFQLSLCLFFPLICLLFNRDFVSVGYFAALILIALFMSVLFYSFTVLAREIIRLQKKLQELEQRMP